MHFLSASEDLFSTGFDGKSGMVGWLGGLVIKVLASNFIGMKSSKTKENNFFFDGGVTVEELPTVQNHLALLVCSWSRVK